MGSSPFHFHNVQIDVCIADVLDRMGRQRLDPLRRRMFLGRADAAAIKKDVPLLVATNEIAPVQRVDNSGPAVRVNRNQISNRDVGMNDAYALIFEQY